MTDAKSRRYHSPTRARAAGATQDAVVETAADLFRSRGYRATTVRAIAETAGVSPQTIYAVFGSKRGVLLELVRRAKEAAAVAQTYRRLVEEPDPLRQLALSVEITVRWSEAGAELVDLVRAEAGSDADVASAWRAAEDSRLTGNAALIRQISARGALRPGLDVESATDLLWALESTDLYRLLVLERGWDPRVYADHLNQLLAATLLAPSSMGSNIR